MTIQNNFDVHFVAITISRTLFRATSQGKSRGFLNSVKNGALYIKVALIFFLKIEQKNYTFTFYEEKTFPEYRTAFFINKIPRKINTSIYSKQSSIKTWQATIYFISTWNEIGLASDVFFEIDHYNKTLIFHFGQTLVACDGRCR